MFMCHLNRLALMQLAVSNNVYLLDMLALSAVLSLDDWRRLVEEVFCSEEIYVLGLYHSFHFVISVCVGWHSAEVETV
jgi:hypothetical protein